MIGACLWVVQVPVTKTKKTVRKVKFPHTSIVLTLVPNICSNKNNDDDDNDDNGQFTQKFTKLSVQRYLGSFGCTILAMIR